MPVDIPYPDKVVYVDRVVYEPARPAYYTVIPNQHCGNSGGRRYVTAPIQANADGSSVRIPGINSNTDVETGRTVNGTATIYANLAVRENLTYAEYLRGIQLLRAIENGTHHVDDNTDVLTGTTPTSVDDITYRLRNEQITQPAVDNARPLLTDIERDLRAQPLGTDGRPGPIPDTPAGFVPLGGDLNVAPTADLPFSRDRIDSTLINPVDARTANTQVQASNTDPNAPRDVFNRYQSFDTNGTVTNGDRTLISNSQVLFSDGTSAEAALGQRGTPVYPRSTATNPFPASR